MTNGQKAFEEYVRASGDVSPYNYELFENDRKAAWEAVAASIEDRVMAADTAKEVAPPEQPALLYKVNKGEDEKFRWIIRDENGEFICDSGPFSVENDAHISVNWLSASKIVLDEVVKED